MKRLIVAVVICFSFCMPVRAQIVPALLNFGLAYWGFSQKNAFGNVAGTLFALRGVGHITVFTLRW